MLFAVANLLVYFGRDHSGLGLFPEDLLWRFLQAEWPSCYPNQQLYQNTEGMKLDEVIQYTLCERRYYIHLYSPNMLDS